MWLSLSKGEVLVFQQLFTFFKACRSISCNLHQLVLKKYQPSQIASLKHIFCHMAKLEKLCFLTNPSDLFKKCKQTS